jgi:hypothetical protein
LTLSPTRNVGDTALLLNGLASACYTEKKETKLTLACRIYLEYIVSGNGNFQDFLVWRRSNTIGHSLAFAVGNGRLTGGTAVLGFQRKNRQALITAKGLVHHFPRLEAAGAKVHLVECW